MVREIQKYENVKIRLCKERRKVPGTEQNPEDSSKIVFSEEVLPLANNPSFLRIDHTDDSGKRTSPNSLQNVCYFGIPTYLQSRRRLAYDHGKCSTE